MKNFPNIVKGVILSLTALLYACSDSSSSSSGNVVVNPPPSTPPTTNIASEPVTSARSVTSVEPVSINETFAASEGKARLLANLNDTPENVNLLARDFVSWQGQVFFVANHPEHGAEIWRYDPETDTSALFFETLPGQASASPSDLRVVDGNLQFFTDLFSSVPKLWQTTAIAEPPQPFSPLLQRIYELARNEIPELPERATLAEEDIALLETSTSQSGLTIRLQCTKDQPSLFCLLTVNENLSIWKIGSSESNSRELFFVPEEQLAPENQQPSPIGHSFSLLAYSNEIVLFSVQTLQINLTPVNQHFLFSEDTLTTIDTDPLPEHCRRSFSPRDTAGSPIISTVTAFQDQALFFCGQNVTEQSLFSVDTTGIPQALNRQGDTDSTSFTGPTQFFPANNALYVHANQQLYRIDIDTQTLSDALIELNILNAYALGDDLLFTTYPNAERQTEIVGFSPATNTATTLLSINNETTGLSIAPSDDGTQLLVQQRQDQPEPFTQLHRIRTIGQGIETVATFTPDGTASQQSGSAFLFQDNQLIYYYSQTDSQALSVLTLSDAPTAPTTRRDIQLFDVQLDGNSQFHSLELIGNRLYSVQQERDNTSSSQQTQFTLWSTNVSSGRQEAFPLDWRGNIFTQQAIEPFILRKAPPQHVIALETGGLFFQGDIHENRPGPQDLAAANYSLYNLTDGQLIQLLPDITTADDLLPLNSTSNGEWAVYALGDYATYTSQRFFFFEPLLSDIPTIKQLWITDGTQANTRKLVAPDGLRFRNQFLLTADSLIVQANDAEGRIAVLRYDPIAFTLTDITPWGNAETLNAFSTFVGSLRNSITSSDKMLFLAETPQQENPQRQLLVFSATDNRFTAIDTNVSTIDITQIESQFGITLAPPDTGDAQTTSRFINPSPEQLEALTLPPNTPVSHLLMNNQYFVFEAKVYPYGNELWVQPREQ